MLRAIFFLDCDYCHEPYSESYAVNVASGVGMGTPGHLEEEAYEHGWCLCLQEDTGQYLHMCGGCHADTEKYLSICLDQDGDEEF